MRTIALLIVVGALLGAPGVALGQVARPGPFQQAVARTAALTIYRATYVVRARGTAADPRAATPPAGEVVLTDFSGAYRAGDSALTYRAADARARGYDEQQGLQLIVSRGVTYAVGPLPVSGALEARWYSFGRQPPAALQPPQRPMDRLADLTEAVDPSRLTRTRFEQLDGRSCAVYRGRPADALATLAALGRPIVDDPGTSVARQLGDAKIERSEYLAWLCNDGYIRQVRVSAAGTAAARGAPPFALDAQLRISEIGSGTLRIPAPRDALALRQYPEAFLGATAATVVRRAPAADAPELGPVAAREAVQLLDRSADGRWYRVRAAAATGWLPATALPATAARARLPVAGQGAPPAATPSPTGATAEATPAGAPETTPTP